MLLLTTFPSAWTDYVLIVVIIVIVIALIYAVVTSEEKMTNSQAKARTARIQAGVDIESLKKGIESIQELINSAKEFIPNSIFLQIQKLLYETNDQYNKSNGLCTKLNESSSFDPDDPINAYNSTYENMVISYTEVTEGVENANEKIRTILDLLSTSGYDVQDMSSTRNLSR